MGSWSRQYPTDFHHDKSISILHGDSTQEVWLRHWSGRRSCPSKHSVHNSQSVALNYSHNYCIPDCAVTVVTTVNSRMKFETCMLTESCQFLEWMAYTSYPSCWLCQLNLHPVSTTCINIPNYLAITEKSYRNCHAGYSSWQGGGLVECIIILDTRVIIKESKRMHTVHVHNNDVFGIPVWNVWSIMTIWYCYLEASLQALGLVSYHDSYLMYLMQQMSTVILIWSSIQFPVYVL